MSTSRCIFLDKDGTLVRDVPYNVDPAKIELMPGALDGLRRLSQAGYRLAVVSNQSGIALGYFEPAALGAVRRRLEEMLGVAGVMLDGFYYCPHHPEAAVAEHRQACACRKPAPGMLLAAAGEMAVDLAGSWMVGDILNDVEAGHRAGCRALLVDNGHETEWQAGPYRTPDARVTDLAEAAEVILATGVPPGGNRPREYEFAD